MTLYTENLTDGQLTLVPATLAMLQAELDINHTQLFNHLDVSPPPYWPPELNDKDSFGHFLNILKTVLNSQGWGAYYAINSKPTRALVGTGGFVVPPDTEGSVEIGYSILRPNQRQGLATRLSRLLVNKAFSDHRVTKVIAHTYPHLIGSIGVLTKIGFQFEGEREDGTVVYKLNR